MNRTVLVCLTTYQRPQRCLDLLTDLVREATAAAVPLDVIILDDGSTLDYTAVATYAQEHGWRYVRKDHGGKTGYWQTINHVWGLAQMTSADFIFEVPDDIRLVPDFFPQLFARWDAITTPAKRLLNPLIDTGRRGRNAWSADAARWEQHGPYTLLASHWNDGCFLAPRSTLDALEWRINPQWQTGERMGHRRGSQVWKDVSIRLSRAGPGLYHSDIPLVHHGVHTSQMHGDPHREGHPLTTERITACMASYASDERLHLLPLVLDRLLPQVDELRLWWNPPGEVPRCFRHEKITLYTGPVDLADAGKLAMLPSEGYVVTLDDDLIVSKGYVVDILQGVERYHRQAIVGYHGVRLTQWPVLSYYRHRQVWHNQQRLDADLPVHLLGTGVAAWHTDCFAPAVVPEDLAEATYMADIWLARQAQEHAIPMVCLAHPSKWVHIVLTEKNIFNSFSRNDGRQTAFVNLKPWTLYPLPGRMAGE